MERADAVIIGSGQAAEVVHLLADLMETGITASRLHTFQHIHPTYTEYLTVLAGRLGPPGSSPIGL